MISGTSSPTIDWAIPRKHSLYCHWFAFESWHEKSEEKNIETNVIQWNYYWIQYKGDKKIFGRVEVKINFSLKKKISFLYSTRIWHDFQNGN